MSEEEKKNVPEDNAGELKSEPEGKKPEEAKTGEDNPKADAEGKSEEKAEAEPEGKSEEKAEAEPEGKSEEKAEADSEENSEEKPETDAGKKETVTDDTIEFKIEIPDPAPAPVPEPAAAKSETAPESAPAAPAAKPKKEEEKPPKKKKKHIVLKIFSGLLIIGILGAGGYAYYYHTQKIDYYTDHFLPTTCNGIDITGMTVDQAAEQIEDTLNYSLTIKGEDIQDVITKEDIDLSFSAEEELTQQLENQDKDEWFLYEYDDKVNEVVLSESYDKDKLEEVIGNLQIMNAEQVAPQNAYEFYNADTKRFEIVPEVEGSQFDKEELANQIRTAVDNRDTVVDALPLYQKPEITSTYEPMKNFVDQANKMLGTKVTIQYRDKSLVVDDNLIYGWLNIDEAAYTVSLNEDTMKYYISTVFDDTLDTKGIDRTFTSLGSGKVVTIGGGSYGGIISTDLEIEKLKTEINDGVTETREPEWYIPEMGTSNDGIGDDYVEVDITDQKTYVVIGNELKYSCDCITGLPGRDTPTGIYSVAWMTTNYKMQDFDCTVAYWMLFESSGCGLHDATWQSSFGGDSYLTVGSHGCVNLSLDSAATIYNLIYTGIPVVVHK